jgi:hypothetical protein
MSTNIVFAIPAVSLIYLTQTILYKPLKKIAKIPLLLLGSAIFFFDLLVTLYFYTGCFEMYLKYGYSNCLNWIYPTLDFKVMVLLSIVLLTLSVWALIQQWKSGLFYLLGSAVVYLGVICRLLIFFQSLKIILNSGSMNGNIIYEFFTIMVVYGLASAFIYTGIFLLGFFRKYTSTINKE